MDAPAAKPLAWLEGLRTQCRLEVEPIAFAASREWAFTPGREALVHQSRRFFSIVGLAYSARGLRGHRPFILQPEIGTLGFLARRVGGELQVLLQGKTEPGNVGGTQIAPTLQATASNCEAVHHGEVPRFLDLFLGREGGVTPLVDQLQSEQAWWFLRKRNRNVVLLLDGEGPALSEHFRWSGLREVRSLLAEDHVVNTDSRSVLASLFLALPPEEICDDSVGFDHELATSLRAADGAGTWSLGQALSWWTRLKAEAQLEVEVVPLEGLPGWRIDEGAIVSTGGLGARVRHLRVHAADREVTDWDQPLVDTTRPGFLGLLCQRRRGVLHVLVQGAIEPGHFDRVELTATVRLAGGEEVPQEPAVAALIALLCQPARGSVLAECRQSEEGGRFLRDENTYRIVLLPDDEALALPREHAWLTLAQLRELVRMSNACTNELRSLLALLFARPALG